MERMRSSSGALILGDAQARVATLIAEIGHEAQAGSPAPQQRGSDRRRTVCPRRGAGNAPTEVLVATFERLGIPTGSDVQAVLAVAEETVRPILPRLPFAERETR
jgi:4-hydroxy 2-oxovalerate aldolase